MNNYLKNVLTILFLTVTIPFFGQKSYKEGEFFKFKISYMFVNAGIATLKLDQTTLNGKSVYHAKGIGYTTGVTKKIFKVYDDYQSYFDKKTGEPYRFIRKIDEGGYTKNQEGFFDQKNNKVLVHDYKNNTKKTFSTTENIQDIVSSFYYLREHPKIDKLKPEQSIEIDMFFDDEVYKFKLKFLGKEEIKTTFGKIKALKFRPYVQSGRVFKEQESLTIWISDDENKIPLRVQASLLVGSLKADLVEYKGLKNKLSTK